MRQEKCQMADGGSFLNFLENSVVCGRNLNTWEFGKGVLSANDIFSTTTPGHERGKTQFWVKDDLNA